MATNGTLPEDALFEILLRLPVKSLVRFRCVSKSWFALFKSLNFINMHLKFSHARDGENLLITRFLKEKNKNLLSVHSNDESMSVLVPNLELEGYGDESLNFVGSSDGIVCVSIFRDIILFNPAIRKIRTLPRLTCPDGCHILRDGMGFGFDPVSNDYKVVQIVAIDDDDDIRLYPDSCGARIYNLRTDTWRELDVVLPRMGYGTFDLLFNGKIHWPSANDSKTFIVTMDMSTEEFHELGYPNLDKTTMDEDAGDVNNLSVMKNSLALILYTSRYPRDHPYEQMIHIWVMEEYGIEESRSKKYCIGPLSGILNLLSVWKNEKILIEKVWNRRGEEDRYGYDCELVAWDALRNEEVQMFDVYGFQDTMGVVVYKETLLSIANT